MSEPIVHVDIYSTNDDTYPERSFRGSLRWVTERMVDEVRRADAAASEAAFRAVRLADHPENV